MAEQQVDWSLTVEVQRLRDRLAGLRGAEGHVSAEPDLLLAELDQAHEELRVADEEVRAQQEELERLVHDRVDAQRMQERFMSLLPAPVLVTDEVGGITYANPAAAAFLGIGLDRVVGKPLFSFVHVSDRRALRDVLVTATRNDAAGFRQLVQVQTRVAPAVTVELAATVRLDERRGGHVVTWALVVDRGQLSTLTTEREASVARALVEMAQLPLSSTDEVEVLQQVTALCRSAFDFPVAASITLGTPAAPDLLATDSRLAQLLDGAQMTAGEGPCQEAWDSQGMVRTSDLRADQRWPRLRARVAALGVGPVVAVPVRTADRVGCLNVYSEDRRLGEDGNVHAVELLSAAVSAVLHENDLKAELARLAEQFTNALSSRAVIDQAKGIVMARHGCDADQAWQLLVKVSSTSNVKVREVAARIVAEVARR